MTCSPTLSLIIPTRKRTGQLRRLLDSLLATAADPSGLEVILVVDADDQESQAFRFDGLGLKRVVVAPGLTMGALNRAGYEASSGALLMLLNDDVVAQTPGWDAVVRDCYRDCPDEILLVHVNDTLFREALCTFPIVSRTFCRLAGGICPPDYVRYRIDDHIEDVFNLLGVLGERRTVYLPEVIFQHFKYAEDSRGHRNYFSDEKTLAIDAPRFEALLPVRKELALRLKEHIDDQARARERRLARSRLDAVQDSLALRVPGRQRVRSSTGIDYKGDIPVTIGLLTPDSQGKLFRRCLRALRANTRNYELLVLEDQAGPDFRRARALNRLLKAAPPGYLVLLEDNFRVGPHWLWDLFRCLKEGVGLVTALARGWAGPQEPQRVLTACGPLMLIETAKCTSLVFEEGYRSSLAYADFGLQAWEAGLEVVGTPLPTVVQCLPGPRPLGGLNEEHLERDQEVFRERWLESGRLGQFKHLAGLNQEERERLVREHLEFLLGQDRLRPTWRQTRLGKVRAQVLQALWRFGGCWRRRGWRGLLQAAWRQFRRPAAAGS